MWMIMMFSTCLHLCHIFIGSSEKLLYWKSVTLLMTPITEPRGHSVKRLKSSTIKTILYFLSLVQIWTESRNLDLMAIGKHCKMHNKYIWHKDSQKGYRRGSHWQEFRSREEITHIFSLELENCIFKSMNSLIGHFGLLSMAEERWAIWKEFCCCLSFNIWLSSHNKVVLINLVVIDWSHVVLPAAADTVFPIIIILLSFSSNLKKASATNSQVISPPWDFTKLLILS